MQPEFEEFNYEAAFIFRIAETVYKCVDNTKTTAYGQKKMNTKRILYEEKVKEFVGDFSKLFEYLKKGPKDAEQIKAWEKHFWRKYPEIFDENEVEMDTDVDATMETESRPIVDREKKPRKVEEKLLSKRTNERFTDHDDVMSNPNSTLAGKIIHLQKATDNVTRRKIHWASLQGQLLDVNQRKFMERLWWK